MKPPCLLLLTAATVLVPAAARASVLFDFENAIQNTGLPQNVTSGGITASLSGSLTSSPSQGYAIWPCNTYGFTPPGFSGLCLYPSGINASDLLIGFDQSLADFSILYADQELNPDVAAIVRVTAYMDNTYVGTNTAQANPPGYWPSQTLSFASAEPFNRVVVHYDTPPVPASEGWGPIFMADDMLVTPAADVPEPATLSLLTLALIPLLARRRKA